MATISFVYSVATDGTETLLQYGKEYVTVLATSATGTINGTNNDTILIYGKGNVRLAAGTYKVYSIAAPKNIIDNTAQDNLATAFTTAVTVVLP